MTASETVFAPALNVPTDRPLVSVRNTSPEDDVIVSEPTVKFRASVVLLPTLPALSMVNALVDISTPELSRLESTIAPETSNVTLPVPSVTIIPASSRLPDPNVNSIGALPPVV